MNVKSTLMPLLALILSAFMVTQVALADHHGGSKSAMKGKAKVKESLVILSSGSLQTQGMAMVLSNTMAAQGTKVSVLLCDAAGDLALKQGESPKMKPKNVSPKMLLQKLMGQGVDVKVCALYLPNSQYSQADLLEGVTAATPPEMAALMTKRPVRVFTF